MEFRCQTIGELKAAISHWPDDKPLIYDIEGNTGPLTIEDWSDEPPANLDWPVAVMFANQK